MAIRPCTKLLSVILNPIINDEESRLCRTSFVMARHAVPLQFTIIHSIFRYADIDSICRCVCRLCRRISVFFIYVWMVWADSYNRLECDSRLRRRIWDISIFPLLWPGTYPCPVLLRNSGYRSCLRYTSGSAYRGASASGKGNPDIHSSIVLIPHPPYGRYDP